MTELLTAAQMRAIEQAAIASGEVTGLELMERAGRGVVEAILDWRPELATAPHRAVVLCGPGNNGGDGFVVARLLRQRGWEVEVFLYGDEAKLPPDAAENIAAWSELGKTDDFDSLIDKYGWDEETNLCFEGERLVFIDAAFGTGLSRPLDDELAQFLVDVLCQSVVYIVSIDVFSGCCSDSGRELVAEGGERRIDQSADLCVTFHRAKTGHLLDDGGLSRQSIRIIDIGLDRFHWEWKWKLIGNRAAAETTGIDRPPPTVTWVGEAGPRNPSLPVAASPPIRKASSDHKYHYGHALLLSGGVGKGGAARLAARGALRIGAGLVTIGCPPAALIENASSLDAVMLAPVKGVEELRAEITARKIKAVCIGPGFGAGERLRAFVATLVDGGLKTHPTTDGERPSVVLDADALTEYANDPETLFAMLHPGCVLTPHEGEFGRLFPAILAKLKEPATKGPAYSKVDATREAAKRAGCVVLFKGADTVIADPDGRCSINSAHYERAAPWLATAGSGDVLTGFITGLLARGFAPMQAAETAAWLHVECARKFGPGLIAEDLPEQLPAVFRDLGL